MDIAYRLPKSADVVLPGVVFLTHTLLYLSACVPSVLYLFFSFRVRPRHMPLDHDIVVLRAIFYHGAQP
jgi:hypothetical protein